ncbi:MAG: hypothetical protein GF398_11930 [Chitinivibrionales bacterium]|nr:hypothetical protein [Chitinivibrionales bacterium]
MNGCYTQLATLDKTPSQEPIQIVSEIDSTSGDTVRTKIIARRDTVVIKEEEQRVCFWTRNFWGEAVLKCEDADYYDEWYFYRHNPWWYRRHSYYGYDQCPYDMYWDPYYRVCRDYRGHPCYSCGSGSGSARGGSSSSSSSSRPGRHSRRYGIPPKNSSQDVPAAKSDASQVDENSSPAQHKHRSGVLGPKRNYKPHSRPALDKKTEKSSDKASESELTRPTTTQPQTSPTDSSKTKYIRSPRGKSRKR